MAIEYFRGVVADFLIGDLNGVVEQSIDLADEARKDVSNNGHLNLIAQVQDEISRVNRMSDRLKKQKELIKKVIKIDKIARRFGL